MTQNEKRAYELYIEEQTSRLLLKVRIEQERREKIQRLYDRMIEMEVRDAREN